MRSIRHESDQFSIPFFDGPLAGKSAFFDRIDDIPPRIRLRTELTRLDYLWKSDWLPARECLEDGGVGFSETFYRYNEKRKRYELEA